MGFFVSHEYILLLVKVKHDKDVFLHRQDAREPHRLPGLHRGGVGDEVDVRHLRLRYTTDIVIHH